jgi:hypothetical protein
VGLLNPHLDDEALAQAWTDRSAGETGETGSSRALDRHLQVCTECQTRYASLTDWLESIRADAHAEADELFDAERLRTQQAQILRRLEALEHPGRVIAFPRFSPPGSIQHAPRRRWIAAAAAAGLVVGVGLGQIFQFGMSPSVPQPEQSFIASRGMQPPAQGRMGGIQTISQPGDEAFLDPGELTPSQARVPESLQYLNAITPLSRDYDPN